MDNLPRMHAPHRTDLTRPLTALLYLAVVWLFPVSGMATDDRLILAIQPAHNEAATRKIFQPLADYISRASGKECVLLIHPDFFSYWNTIRKGTGYDLVLDEAHFTDYRISKLGFTVLAKAPNMVTYSLIVAANNPLRDPARLNGKRVATLGIPSVGAARLNAIFPNPTRQPITIETNSFEEGFKMLEDGAVSAAILPTPFVSQRLAAGAAVRVVLLTEPIPHMALSAAPTLDESVRDAVRKALLLAGKSEDGQQMLQSLEIDRFDPASPAVYAGQSRILAEYWGY